MTPGIRGSIFDRRAGEIFLPWWRHMFACMDQCSGCMENVFSVPEESWCLILGRGGGRVCTCVHTCEGDKDDQTQDGDNVRAPRLLFPSHAWLCERVRVRAWCARMHIKMIIVFHADSSEVDSINRPNASLRSRKHSHKHTHYRCTMKTSFAQVDIWHTQFPSQFQIQLP